MTLYASILTTADKRENLLYKTAINLAAYVRDNVSVKMYWHMSFPGADEYFI